MKATYFLPLALCTFASASPRISQISPVSGNLSGAPVAFDIDQDGDLDIAYLANPRHINSSHIPGIPSPPSQVLSTWLENLGNRTFSPPKALGYRFNSSRLNTLTECLVLPSGQNETRLISIVQKSQPSAIEVYSKSMTASSWTKLQTFNDVHAVSVLESPADDSPFIFTQASPVSTTLEIREVPVNGPPLLRGTISLPEHFGPDEIVPHTLQAVDFDLDGDSDLTFIYHNQTLIYERTGPYQFSESPIIESRIMSLIGDLNRDGFPDLTNRNAIRHLLLGSASFEFSAQSFPSTYQASVAIGAQGDQPILIVQDTNRIIYGAPNESLNQITESAVGFDSPSNDTPLVADFDQDGFSDLVFIERSVPSARFVTSGRGGDWVLVSPILLNNIPSYDVPRISWGQSGAPALPLLAYPDAPINCTNPLVGDFNNDTFPDLVVGPDINGNAIILLNDGSGNFSSSRVLHELYPDTLDSGAFEIQDFVAVDLDSDGNLDLSYTLLETSQSADQSLLLTACVVAKGNGHGGFESINFPSNQFELVARGFCRISKFIDWDNDGDLDAILPGAWRENIDGTLRDSAYPLLQNDATIDALGNPVSLPAHGVGDIDGDGFPDLVVPALNLISPSAFNQDPFGGLTFQPAIYSVGVGFNTGNGNLENITERKAQLATTDALGNPVIMPFLGLDLNLDGAAELLISDTATDPLGNPTNTRFHYWTFDPESPRDLSQGTSTTLPVFSLPFHQVLSDFNGDRELEYVAHDQFLTPTTRGPLISPVYNFKGPHLSSSSYRKPEAVAVGDFDQDGDTDALYASRFGGLHLVRNTLVDEDSPITPALVAEGLTPAQATPQVDADGDGRANALEFLQGTNPLIADEPPADFPSTTLSSNGQRLIFNRSIKATELALYYDLEVSQDLVNWARVTNPETSVESTNGNWQKVSVEIPRNSASNYIRISATHDPRRQ